MTQTLTVFFAVTLAKKYTNPSSDIIEVLAGLDSVDAVFAELVTTLDQTIKDGRTGKSNFLAVNTLRLTIRSWNPAKGCADNHCSRFRRIPDGAGVVFYQSRLLSSAHEGAWRS